MTGAAIPVLILCGATACGKTALAGRLFAAGEESPFAGMAEVISADSMQAYCGMDIGTAKPEAEFLKKLPHHLIDICSPKEPFGAGEFVRCADLCCRDIARRGKIPVIVGGTAFYIKNFIYGLPPTPQADMRVRAELQRRLQAEGAPVLYEELLDRDPESAARIHPNDAYRIVRALEVPYTAGKPLSSYRQPQQPRAQYRFCVLFLVRDRAELYKRIAERTEAMFESGLAEEVESLVRGGCTEHDPGMQAIGYKEFFTVRRSDFSENALWLSAVKAAVISDSCRYAKRQETFFKRIDGALRCGADDYDGAARQTALFMERCGTAL